MRPASRAPESGGANMPQRSAVSRLPREVKEALERELIERGFRDYAGLETWLTERGFEISASAIHRHGQRLERKLSAIKASTEAANIIAQAAPDDQDQRSAAVLSLVQSDLFDCLLALQEAGDAEPAARIKLLSQAARSIAEVSRASVGQKRWASEVQAKLAQAFSELETEGKAGKLDKNTLKRVREAVYGIL